MCEKFKSGPIRHLEASQVLEHRDPEKNAKNCHFFGKSQNVDKNSKTRKISEILFSPQILF